MAYYDRGYYKDGGNGGGGGDFWGRVLRFLNQSFPIGTYFDVRVRIHITFILFVGLEILLRGHPAWTLRWTALLFGSVLLHEFGHALSCRAVGGQANDILMWPLGGLAFCAPPRRPWPEFVTVACGPLVNVVIAAVCYGTLLAMLGMQSPVSLNPMQIFAVQGFGLQGLILDLYYVNYILLLFNLILVFFPFDGGRLVQIALWTKLGYEKSLFIATRVGMVGAVGIGLYGLAYSMTMLIFIAVFGFHTCYQQAQALRYGAYGANPYGDGGFVADHRSAPKKPGFFERRRQASAQRRAQKQAEHQRREEAEIDRILAKVGSEGLQSLTEQEKRALQQATEKKRGG